MKKIVLALSIFLFAAGASVEASALNCCAAKADCSIAQTSQDGNDSKRKTKKKCCTKTKVEAAAKCVSEAKEAKDAQEKNKHHHHEHASQVNSEHQACCEKNH